MPGTSQEVSGFVFAQCARNIFFAMETVSLESSLGYEFHDKALLALALTHTSRANERGGPTTSGDSSGRGEHNESLEFVGDSVLGLVVAETLYREHPEADEGTLTLMKHRLVSSNSLAAVARSISLGERVRLGRGEQRAGGSNKDAILADALEAVFGAVFFDGGYEAAAECVRRVMAERIVAADPRASHDHKTALQEVLQARKLPAPTYRIVSSEGPPHQRTFFVEAAWAGGSAAGTGPSIKAAEMVAASAALEAIMAADENRGNGGSTD